MNRRKFIKQGSGLSVAALAATQFPFLSSKSNDSAYPITNAYTHRLPKSDFHYQVTSGYVEDDPSPGYSWASEQAYEDFKDIKFGIRLHWGLYSILQQRSESWPLLNMSFEQRQAYQDLHKSWYPGAFDAQSWVDLFVESGARMFAMTSKHHDGFSMYDTATKVKRRVNWLAPGGPAIEDCDTAYSIMNTPFKRDVIRELTDEAHKRNIKIDLYFSHPDWYDADFRPYNYHPLQVPDSDKIAVMFKDREPEIKNVKKYFRKSGLIVKPNPTSAEVTRMMQRHRGQLEELITRYGKIDMICLDQWLGPDVWPQLRETMEYLRKIRPDIMYRARGIGNYGDYYTPEGFIPGSKENSDSPWFVIYPLGDTFSYEARAEKYKGAKWMIQNLIDAAAKGGNFMVGIGPDGHGCFHRQAVSQLKQTGAWLKANGQGIYATRAREGNGWKEGEGVRFTQSKDKRTVFAFCYEWPEHELLLRSVIPKTSSEIYLMGVEKPLRWTYDSSKGLIIETPAELMQSIPENVRLAYCFKMKV